MKKALLLFTFFIHSIIFSQNIPLSNDASVSVFTCGKGEELYTTFGHTAIRIKDNVNNLDLVYNYGMFDFREGNFYLKFIKGDLQYFVAAFAFQDFIYEYQSENREVIEQTLNLSVQKKQELFDLLNASLFSDERFYTYKFIDRNCTTKVAEKINKIVGTALIQKVDDKSISYREVLYPYFENHFWYKLGINIVFGAKTDDKAERLFLPVELLNSLDKAVVKGKPLVEKKEIIIKEKQDENSFSFFNSIYFVSSILLILLLINNKIITKTYLIISGILGIFISLLGLYSLHHELLWNYNALLFNPLFLIPVFLKNKNWSKYMILICVVCLATYTAIMVFKPHLTLMLPFIITSGIILFKEFKTTKLLPSVE